MLILSQHSCNNVVKVVLLVYSPMNRFIISSTQCLTSICMRNLLLGFGDVDQQNITRALKLLCPFINNIVAYRCRGITHI